MQMEKGKRENIRATSLNSDFTLYLFRPLISPSLNHNKLYSKFETRG